MTCGVYEIKNKVNGKKYIGSAIKIEKRWWKHRGYLRKGIHVNKFLQDDWNRYGENNFEFSILCICPIDQCLSTEQSYLPAEKTYEALKAQGFYNEKWLVMGGARIVSDETKEKLRLANSGEPAWNKGKSFSEETKERMRLAQKRVWAIKKGIEPSGVVKKKVSPEVNAEKRKRWKEKKARKGDQ